MKRTITTLDDLTAQIRSILKLCAKAGLSYDNVEEAIIEVMEESSAPKRVWVTEDDDNE